MGIDICEAKKLVEQELNKLSESPGSLVVQEELTLCEDFGWVFFYNSQKYIETGDFKSSLVGNAPIVVLKDDGSIRYTGTAHPVEYYLKAFRRKWWQFWK